MADGVDSCVAERKGFEPPVQLPGQRFSRPPHSTTLASLLFSALTCCGNLIRPLAEKVAVEAERCKYSLFFDFNRNIYGATMF